VEIICREGLAASRIVISGNHMLRRTKRSMIEVAAPKEEEMWYSQTDDHTALAHCMLDN